MTGNGNGNGSPRRRVLVVGAGAWGTTVARHLAERHDVLLWARDPERAARMEGERENKRYLPSFRFPPSLHVVSGTPLPPDLRDGVDFVVGGVPTQHVRAVFTELGDSVPDAPYLSLSKGIEIGTGKLPCDIFREAAGRDGPVAMLTGPCIAREVARRLPTAVLVAGDEAELFQDACNDDAVRVYTSEDRIGAELSAGLKNVLALAAGIVDGMQLGDNAKAALLTRGIVELMRLGVALGAEALTFTGLAGFGDLFTTCVSPFGRNRGVGERLGKGEKLAAILETMDSVAEGVPTTRAVVEIARARGVEMPIAEAMQAILFEEVPIREAVETLMTRAARAES